MKKIKKPKDIKSLNKIKEEWFDDQKEIIRIIRYNKGTGGSMWTKQQKADLDARESKLNNKIDDVESRLNKKIDNVKKEVKKNSDGINKIISILNNKL